VRGGDGHGLASSGRGAVRRLLVEVVAVASRRGGGQMGSMVRRFADHTPSGRGDAARRAVRGVPDTGSGVVGASWADRGSVNVERSGWSVGDGWTTSGGIRVDGSRDIRLVRLVILDFLVVHFFFERFRAVDHIVGFVVFGDGWVLSGRSGGARELEVERHLLTRCTVCCNCWRWKDAIGHVAGPESPIVGEGSAAG
jgi:hypothetical protein